MKKKRVFLAWIFVWIFAHANGFELFAGGSPSKALVAEGAALAGKSWKVPAAGGAPKGLPVGAWAGAASKGLAVAAEEAGWKPTVAGVAACMSLSKSTSPSTPASVVGTGGTVAKGSAACTGAAVNVFSGAVAT